jgi:hypothetical protein
MVDLFFDEAKKEEYIKEVLPSRKETPGYEDDLAPDGNWADDWNEDETVGQWGGGNTAF